MILYYDNYIIDSPLTVDTIKSIKKIRSGDSIYKMPSKLDISKYSLSSYKIFPWSKIIIKIDAERKEDREDFIKYAREIFPDAEIIDHRSDTQKEYCKTINEICKLDDEWIFYIPNNDHPMITNDISHIHELVEKAKHFKKKYKYVSIIFTMISMVSINRTDYFKDVNVIEDTDTSLVMIKPNGLFFSGQIFHKDLLKYIFCSHDFGTTKVIRIEDIEKFLVIKDQLVISPKKQICDHFDGHSNTYGTTNQITEDQIPPLFIPPGFFENSIKISYGYSEYRKGWVNINPDAKHYSFKNKKDITDLKICIEDIPLFWKDKISEIDINPNADFEKLRKKRDEYYEIYSNPWKNLSYRIWVKIKSFLYLDIYVSSVVFFKRLINK